MAMPTAIAKPWPSGPVVTSTPSVSPDSGCPGVLRSPLAEALQIVERHVVAGEKQRGVEQRRSVAVRQHKAIAIGPLRVRRIVLHQLVKQQVGDGRAAQRRAGMAALGLLHRVDREQPQCVNGKLVEGEYPQAGSHNELESIPFDEVLLSTHELRSIPSFDLDFHIVTKPAVLLRPVESP